MIDGSWAVPGAGDATDMVRIAGLSVEYSPRLALDDVNLRVPAGEIFGLLGPNGAGKTTMFRVMATLLPPTRGEVELCGRKMKGHCAAVRSMISYMPDMAPVPSDLKVVEYLRFFAEAYGLRGAARDRRVAECLDAMDLQERAKDFCTRLSLGMRQRLALAKSMLHRPRLLILDEPASGLDPLARADLRKALRRQAAEGSTIILSSHVMAEIADLCTSIGLLQSGRLLEAGPLKRVLARFAPEEIRLVIQAPGQRREMLAWLENLPGVRVDQDGSATDSIGISLDETVLDRARLFSLLGASGLGVTGMREVETSVEEVVMNLAQAGGLK